MAALVIVSLAPAIALLAYIYLRDAYEPEPRALVLKVFLAGAALVFVAALVEEMLTPFFAGDVVLESFVVAGLTEEAIKLLGALTIFYRSSQFNEEIDGVVYSSALALGFASAENALYVAVQGVPTGILRAVLPVPGHALFAIAMGSYLGKARFGRGAWRTFNLMKALFVPAAMHGAFNYFLSSDPMLAAFALPLVAYLWIQGMRWIRLAEDGSPFRRKVAATKREVA